MYSHPRNRGPRTRIALWVVLISSLGVGTLWAEDRLRDVAFTAKIDGSEQRYIELLPEKFDPNQPHDVLIALHGHGSDRWQFAKGDFAEVRAAKDVAAAHGMIYISPDYRAKTSWMGPAAEADVLQIIGDLQQAYKVRRVFLTGASMGGSSCLTFAALHPERIAGVASMNGTANHVEYQQFQEAIAESFGGNKTDKFDEYKRRSAEYWPEKFTMPVGIAAGGQDKLVPPESVVRLGQVLTAMKKKALVLYRPDGGHNTTYDDAKQILEYVIEQAELPKEE